MTVPGESRERYGIALFLLLAVVLVVIGVIVTGVTGPMGIEERFTSAVGLHQEPGVTPGEAGTGFSLEGHPVLYIAFLGILVIACFLLYRKYRI